MNGKEGTPASRYGLYQLVVRDIGDEVLRKYLGNDSPQLRRLLAQEIRRKARERLRATGVPVHHELLWKVTNIFLQNSLPLAREDAVGYTYSLLLASSQHLFSPERKLKTLIEDVVARLPEDVLLELSSKAIIVAPSKKWLACTWSVHTRQTLGKEMVTPLPIGYIANSHHILMYLSPNLDELPEKEARSSIARTFAEAYLGVASTIERAPGNKRLKNQRSATDAAGKEQQGKLEKVEKLMQRWGFEVNKR